MQRDMEYEPKSISDGVTVPGHGAARLQRMSN